MAKIKSSTKLSAPRKPAKTATGRGPAQQPEASAAADRGLTTATRGEVTDGADRYNVAPIEVTARTHVEDQHLLARASQ